MLLALYLFRAALRNILCEILFSCAVVCVITFSAVYPICRGTFHAFFVSLLFGMPLGLGAWCLFRFGRFLIGPSEVRHAVPKTNVW